jgi:hypothetical protein
MQFKKAKVDKRIKADPARHQPVRRGWGKPKSFATRSRIPNVG